MSKVMKAIASGYVDWKNSKECTNKKSKEAKKSLVLETMKKGIPADARLCEAKKKNE